jgi:hypothetical protein
MARQFEITRRDGYVFLWWQQELVATMSESEWSYALAHATVAPSKREVDPFAAGAGERVHT